MIKIKIFGFNFEKELPIDFCWWLSVLFFCSFVAIIITINVSKTKSFELEKFKIEKGITDGESKTEIREKE